MTKKISIKNIYLIAIISVGLIGLAVGSTYAMFTATAEINNPISLASNLTYVSDIVETVDVTVAPGETEYVNFEVWSITDDDLNYAAWYIGDSSNLDFGIDYDESVCGPPTGVLDARDGVVIKILVRNNGTSTVTVTLGVSSSTGNVVLADNMAILPNTSLPVITHTVTIKRQLGTASATTIQNLSVNDGSNSSTVSVAGTSAYPTYESISCSNGQTASVTKTTSGGIDTAKVTVSNVKSDTVCTVKFKVPSYTVTIKRQLGTATATTIQTLTVNKGSSSSQVSVAGTSAYPTYESISCTNSQTGSVTRTTSGGIDTAKVTVSNVTNTTVCTVKFKSGGTSSTSYTVRIYNNGTLLNSSTVTSGNNYEGAFSDAVVDVSSDGTIECSNGYIGYVGILWLGDRSQIYLDISSVTSDVDCDFADFVAS